MFSKKLVGYGIGKQLREMFVPLLVAIVIGVSIYPISFLHINSHLLVAVLQCVAAMVLAILIDKVFRLNVISDLLALLRSVMRPKA
jgi:hypothetical protein